MTQTTTTPSKLRRSPALDNYFRALDRVPTMVASDEHDKAMELRSLRRAYWDTLFSFPALRERLRAAAVEQLGEKSSKAFRTHEGPLDVDAFAKIDPGCDVADRIAADLETLYSGSANPTPFSLHAATRRSKGFRDYVLRLRRRRAALHRARQEFTSANLRLVITVAQRYASNGFLPLADLVQEGNVGLMTAVDRFDATRGFRFSTYAAWWIRHAITRALSDRGRAVRLPVHVIELRTRLRQESRKFEQKNGRPPTDAELASAADVELDKVQRLGRVLLQKATPASLTDDDSGSDDTLDRLSDEVEDPADMMDQSAQHAVLGKGMETLRPMESAILRMRFGFDEDPPKTLREVGEVYSLSRERIRQVQNAALDKLRAALEAEGFSEAITVLGC